jgi:hypothetical protein
LIGYNKRGSGPFSVMRYKITKMDGRYSHYGYTYLLEFSRSVQHGTGVLDFDRARRWFNTTFGWSQDVETRAKLFENRQYNKEAYTPDDINAVWAYAVKYGDYRIYIKDDQTLAWFVLAHPNESNS